MEGSFWQASADRPGERHLFKHSARDRTHCQHAIELALGV